MTRIMDQLIQIIYAYHNDRWLMIEKKEGDQDEKYPNQFLVKFFRLE